MIFNNDRFYLFENCKPIKGASNNIICDLQRKDFSYISNELYALIIKHHGKTLKELLLFYKKENGKQKAGLALSKPRSYK